MNTFPTVNILITMGIKLWVVDNLASVAGGLDENSRQDWDPVNQWLLELRFAGITTMILLVLGTGLVERVYWWRLVARGYGLIASGGNDSLRRRPSFHSLKTLNRRLEGSIFLGPLSTKENAYLYLFERDGKQQVVGWALAADHTEELPAAPTRAFDRDGHEIDAPSGPRVRLGPSPVYFEL